MGSASPEASEHCCDNQKEGLTGIHAPTTRGHHYSAPIWLAWVDARGQAALRRHLSWPYRPWDRTRNVRRGRGDGAQARERAWALGVVRGDSSEREENARQEFQGLRLDDPSIRELRRCVDLVERNPGNARSGRRTSPRLRSSTASCSLACPCPPSVHFRTSSVS